ncbi:hypothetical protein LTR62_005856 [Meristemomyces frigidus]|uniref:DNA polymerase delta subunit 4 n=1 Tax=Meristemomyces frigidus TaxID=1508187 RepID=A0AAN7TQJ9_9PEZI|nr:hypothetical protein LTR62_005856 [Meristemomyces frigidus]
MPPKRNSTGPRAIPTRQSSQSQATLSFNGKQNKVTKPSAAQQAKSGKRDPAVIDQIIHADVKSEAEPDLDEPTTAEAAIEQQVEEEAGTAKNAPSAASVKTEEILGGRAPESDVGAIGGKGAGWVADEEAQARKVTDEQIKKYWKAKESERLAPRVHQEDLTVYAKVLREWDMSGQFGPCIGIARLKRWKRANLLGLKPPVEVLAVLLKEMDGGNPKAQRAYVDELMSTRFVET